MGQKTWKRRLALALAAAMTLNTGMLTSFAKWQDKDGKWYYTDDETGEQIKGKVKKIHGEWYSFDQNGVMEADKWIQKDGATFYATPEGQLAVNKWICLDGKWYRFGDVVKESGSTFSGGLVKEKFKEVHGKWYSFDPETGVMRCNEWVTDIIDGKTLHADQEGALASGWKLLSEDGKDCTHSDVDCGCRWYYFKRLNHEDENKRGIRVENKDHEQIGPDEDAKYYAFDAEGRMLSQQWGKDSEGKEKTYYYQHNGDMAANKWLPFKDEGLWYHFDADGNVDDRMEFGDVASPSGAQRVVSSIKPAGEREKEAVVGIPVTLEFQIATSSNAQRSSDDWSEYHDIWFSKLKEGRTRYVESNGDSCIVEYWNNNINGKGEEIYLYIDGVKSTGSFRVRTVEPTTDEDVDKVLENVPATVEDFNELDEKEKGEAANQFKVAYEAADDSKKEELQENWLDEDYYKLLIELEKSYAGTNKLADATVVPEPNALNLLWGDDEEDNNKITMVGGSFNAEDPDDSVKLELTEPEQGWGDKLSDVKEDVAVIKEDTVTIAVDLSFYLNDKAQKQLKVPVVITMPLPAGFEDATKETLKLLNLHNGGVTSVKFDITGEGEIRFVTDKFSTYVFVLNSSPEDDPGTDAPVTPNRPSHSGGGSSSGGSSSSSRIAGTLAGQWMQDEIGWWFLLSDGSYAVNSWQYVAYNGTARWYRFDEKGYICKGWFTDTDGHRYYLNPVSDGLMGAMLTGWQQIDGIWYYFNTVSDGTQGALLVNTTTPDGYSVDANGQWIQ